MIVNPADDFDFLVSFLNKKTTQIFNTRAYEERVLAPVAPVAPRGWNEERGRWKVG
jgi:hypothetical protein